MFLHKSGRRMKRLTKKNICVSSWCQVVAVFVFVLQIIQLVDAQNLQGNSIHPDDQLELTINTNERQERALNNSAEDCPLCNLSEVSGAISVIQRFFSIIRDRIPVWMCEIFH